MTKKDFLDALTDARTAHVKWHAYAQALAMGIESGAEKLPQLYTDCTFGKWYYSTGHFLSFMPEFREIEPIHENLHKLYIQIYQKYLSPDKVGLFFNSAKAKARKQKEMNIMVVQLKEISNILLDKMTLVETNLNNMSDDDLRVKIQ
ncbi:MAG: CZB domain-containing protein [Bacteroidales bacterium]|nr:CZB domain-containing protein [Bacteroidales bacterium]